MGLRAIIMPLQVSRQSLRPKLSGGTEVLPRPCLEPFLGSNPSSSTCELHGHGRQICQLH